MDIILHGLKSAGIFNENKRFLGKVIFIPQHSCLRGLGIAIFQHFDALSVVRNVQAKSKYASVSAMISSFDVNLFP